MGGVEEQNNMDKNRLDFRGFRNVWYQRFLYSSLNKNKKHPAGTADKYKKSRQVWTQCYSMGG